MALCVGIVSALALESVLVSASAWHKPQHLIGARVGVGVAVGIGIGIDFLVIVVVVLVIVVVVIAIVDVVIAAIILLPSSSALAAVFCR